MGYIRDFRVGLGALPPGGPTGGSRSFATSAPTTAPAEDTSQWPTAGEFTPKPVVTISTAVPVIRTIGIVTGKTITLAPKSKDVTLNLPPTLPGVPLKTRSSGGGGDSSSDTPPATLPSGSSGNYTKAPSTTDVLAPTTTTWPTTTAATPATSSGSTAKTALIAGVAAVAALLLAKLL